MANKLHGARVWCDATSSPLVGDVAAGTALVFPEYEPYEPEYGLVRNVLTPARARRAFAGDMEVKDRRLSVFARYASSFGVTVGYEDADIERVYAWLAGIVTVDEHVDLVAATTGPPELNTEPVYLDPVSLSLAWDFGLFLGEAIIHRHPSLGWELGRGSRRFVNSQRPAVGHYLHENGYVEQWPAMWKAQAALEGAAVGDPSSSLLIFVNFFPEGM